MNLSIISIGKRTTPFDGLVSDYQKRIKKPFALSLEILSPAGIDDREKSRKIETEKLVSKIKTHRDSNQKQVAIFLLDEAGMDITTKKFSELLEKKRQGGITDCLFIIGGSYGFDMNSIKQEFPALVCIKLSSLTLPHEFAKALLVEQVYRALDIIAGGKYHHE